MDFNLSTEELEVQRLAKEFTENEIEPLAEQIEKEERAPDDMIKKLADVGFLGMFVPTKYGGGETSIFSHLLVYEQLSQSGTGVEAIFGSNNAIPHAILDHASEEIKQKYLPQICKGEVCASFAFTEPETGSDAKMIKTTATPDGDSYLLNGTKRFITWGASDGPLVLFAKDESGRVSGFITDKNVPGYTADPPFRMMGLPAVQTMDIHLDNVRIPKSNRIGEIGGAYSVLMPWISCEKIEQSFGCLGMAEAAFAESVKYAKERMVRNGPMANLQGIQWTLAEMQTKIEAARSLAYRCGMLMEEKSPDWIEMAALAKNFVIPTALDVCRMAMQIHSAYGYTKEFKVERLFRAACCGLGVIVSLEVNKSIIGGSIVRG